MKAARLAKHLPLFAPPLCAEHMATKEALRAAEAENAELRAACRGHGRKSTEAAPYLAFNGLVKHNPVI